MENEEKMDETRKIEVVKAEEMAEIWSIYTEYQDNYDYIMPDNAEISVEDTIIVWEATNLKITMLKDWSTMTTYSGAILITITDENWDKLKDNEYTLPSRWVYQFLLSDLWEKEFQKWLEIKKEWTYYIEIEDLNEYEDKLIWRQKIVVTKKE